MNGGTLLLAPAAALCIASAGGAGLACALTAAAYIAALAALGWVLARTFPAGVAAEGMHTAIGIGIWGGALVAAAALPALVRGCLLAASPPVVLGGILGVNIFRDQWYGIAPLGDGFIRLPAWWQGVTVLAVIAAAAAGMGALVRMFHRRPAGIPAGAGR